MQLISSWYFYIHNLFFLSLSLLLPYRYREWRETHPKLVGWYNTDRCQIVPKVKDTTSMRPLLTVNPSWYSMPFRLFFFFFWFSIWNLSVRDRLWYLASLYIRWGKTKKDYTKILAKSSSCTGNKLTHPSASLHYYDFSILCPVDLCIGEGEKKNRIRVYIKHVLQPIFYVITSWTSTLKLNYFLLVTPWNLI